MKGIHTYTHLRAVALLTVLMLLLTGCYNDKSHRNIEYSPNMYNSLPLEPYSQTDYQTQPEIGGHYPAADADGMVPFFENGLAAQKAPEGTVPRSESWYYEEAWAPYPYPNSLEGYEEAGADLESPLACTEATFEQGKALYEIYCTMCHGANGNGQGSLVKGGAYGGVPAYNTLNLPEGKMFHTLTWGKNNMGSYASQMTPKERWQVICYIKQWFPNYNNDAAEEGTATASAATAAPATANSVATTASSR